MSALESMLRSFRHRNFKLYFTGQLISMVGTWMQMMAQMWLVYRLTHSSFLLGLVGFAGQAPFILLGLFGGVVADRHDRKVLMLWTQTASLVQALILGALTVSGLVQVWHVFALAVVLGVVNVFDMPARQAFVVELVDRADLGNAIALNSFIVNASRMLGPTLAGFIVGYYGEGACFLLNALSYVAVLASLWMLELPRFAGPGGQDLTDAMEHIRAGLRYTFSQKEMRALLLLLGLISLAGVPFMVLMPIFTDRILHSGAKGLGLLMGATGVGSMVSSFMLAHRRHNAGLPRLVGLAAGGFGLSLVLFAFSKRMEFSLMAMVFTGWGMMTAFSGCNTLLQTLTVDAMRGRVMGLFSMTFMGIAPVGNFLSGYVAESIGAPWTLALGGLACVLGGAVFMRRGEAAA